MDSGPSEDNRLDQLRINRAQRIARFGFWERDIKKNELFWSEGIFDIFGVEKSEFKGTFEDFIERVHQDDQEFVKRALQEAIDTKTTYSIGHRVVRPGGEIRYVHEDGEITFNDQGEALRILGTVRDITPLKIIELALLESEENYRMLTEQAADAIVLMDKQGKLLDINNKGTQVMGYTKEEIRRLHVTDITPKEHLVEMPINYDGLIEGREYTQERLAICKNGSIIPVEISAKMLPNGTIQGIVRDISERREAERRLREKEEQLRQATKMEALGRLTGGIAHDFNNLLSVILNYSSLLLSPNTANEELKEGLETIQSTARRGSVLLRQLLSFTRRSIENPQNINVNDVLSKDQIMLLQFVGRNINLISEFDPTVNEVYVDPDQIHQILVNLVLNARDAITDRGDIIIKTSNVEITPEVSNPYYEVKSGSYVMFSVTDTGVGISQEDLPKIFDPFFTTKGKDKGTGLGLSVTYRIVQQYGGFINVITALDVGTTFEIYLPAYTSPKGEIIDDIRPEQLDIYTILLAVGDEELRKSLSMILKRENYDVLPLKNLAQGMDIITNFPTQIHIAIVDIESPDLFNSIHVDHLEKHFPGIKMVLAIDYLTDTLEKIMKKPNTTLLQKPVEWDILEILLLQLLHDPNI
ncbi:MAG: PAS domain S-box protein [Candidatus Kariarchaeaceae archaeon]|jgi:PAS domain S-box-containing protein